MSIMVLIPLMVLNGLHSGQLRALCHLRTRQFDYIESRQCMQINVEMYELQMKNMIMSQLRSLLLKYWVI